MRAIQKDNQTCADGALSLKMMLLMTGISALLAMSVEAAQPAWWAARGAINSNPRNDNAVVNEGQLKKFTFEAVQELNADLSGSGGAGSTLNGMATGWSNYFVAHGVSTNDWQDMNVGQLKYMASLVYPQLISAGYMYASPTWLQTNSLVDTNFATIGQLKQVFAFEIAAPQTPIDITVDLEPTTATVTWADPVISVTTFTVQYSSDGGSTWTSTTVPGNVFTDTISGLTSGVNYAFRVTAGNTAGSSSPSGSTPQFTLDSPLGATLVP